MSAMRNPYVINRQSSSVQSSSSSSQKSHNAANKASNANLNADANLNLDPPSRDTTELTKTLRAYHQSKNGSSNELNTSFSVSSHNMRQRKLLRAVNFEMQQLIQYPLPYDDIQSSLYYIKSAMNLDYNIQIQSNSEIEKLIRQVLDTVQTTVIEEYCEQEEAMLEQELEQEQDADVSTTSIPNVRINLNSSTWNNNEEAGDNLIAALSFLDTAYACLDCEIVFHSLMVPVQVAVNYQDDNNQRTIVEALLYFVAKEERGNSQSHSSSSGQWDKVQQLALSVLTKAMLCAEYIQKYSSSMSILPEDGVDSLFGVGMGLGLDHYRMRNRIEVLYRRMLNVLAKEHLINDTDAYGEEAGGHFRMSCMGMLALLYRTKLMDVARIVMMDGHEEIQKRVVEKLHNATQGIDDHLIDKNGRMDQRSKSKPNNVTSFMALSLLTLIQSVHLVDVEGKESPVINDSTLETLLKRVLESQGGAMHAGATHVLIHLCTTKDVCLRRFTNTRQFENIAALGFHSMLTSDDVWRRFREKAFAFVHLNSSFASPLRKTINAFIKNEDEAYLSNLLGVLLNSASRHSLSLMTPALLLFKSLMVQSTLNGQWQLRDNLARKSWKVVIKNSSLVKAFVGQIQTKYEKGSTLKVQLMLDALNFMQTDAQFKSECSNVIEDAIEILTSTAKGSDSSESTPDAVRYSLQVSAATSLSHLYMSAHGDKKSALQSILQRFATNSLDARNDSTGGSMNLTEGALEYSLCQAPSRDLLRRALNLQSMLPCIIGGDSFDTTCILFSSALKIRATNDVLRKCVERKEGEFETMRMQNNKLAAERDFLSDKCLKSKLCSDRELRIKLAAASADAMDMAQANEEEKKDMTNEMSRLQNDLNTVRREADTVLKDFAQEKLDVGNKLKQSHTQITALEERLGDSEIKLERYKHQCLEKESRLEDALSDIKEMKSQLDRIKNENEIISRENGDVKMRLEASLAQLISLTHIYTAKEKEFGSERSTLIDKLRLAKSDIEVEIAERHRVENKYSTAKDKYQTLKQRYEHEVRRREEEIVQHENERKEQKKRREEEKSKRRQDGRRPMGTLDFMNSIHDTSMRSERGGAKSATERHDTSNRESRKKGSFRIIK